MRRIPSLLSFVVLLFVVACEPDPQPNLHDIYLYGLEGGDVRYSVFYGGPTELALDDGTVVLTEGAAGDAAFAVPGALLADGQPYRAASVDAIEAPVAAARIPLTTSLQVRAAAPVESVAYFDGQMWLTLLEAAAAGTDRRVAPKPRIGRLRGVGSLTPPEADALADFLEQQGRPLIVASLPADALPQRTVDGLAAYRATGLFVQDEIPVDPRAYSAPPEQLTWEVIARGDQAVGFEEPAFRLVANEQELLELWNRAWGSQLEVPPVPDVSFERETILAIFQGERPTGGYGIEVMDVVVEGEELFVDMRFVEPAPDAIVTQALTSPWALVRVLRGGIDVAWFRNPVTGELLGVARADGK